MVAAGNQTLTVGGNEQTHNHNIKCFRAQQYTADIKLQNQNKVHLVIKHVMANISITASNKISC